MSTAGPSSAIRQGGKEIALGLRLAHAENALHALTSGQVDAIVDRFEAELGTSTVVATGGLAELIMPHSRTIQHFEPWLTLQGLRIVHERNAG